MAIITNSSNSSLLILREASPGVLPSSPVYRQLRFTGSTLSPSLQTEISDEITPSSAVTDLIPTKTEAGGDTSHELSYGTEIDLLLEFALRGRFTSNTLKGSNYDDTARILQIIRNKSQNFVFGYPSCKADSLAMNIGADNAKDNFTITWSAKEEILYPQYFFFTDEDAVPNDLFGREGAIWLKQDDGTVYQYSNYKWTNTNYTFTAGATWTASSGQGTGGSANDWHIDTDTGDFWFNNAGTWELAFTVLPENTAWFSGAGNPTSGIGDKDDAYLNTTDGTIWQNIFNGLTSDWVKVVDCKDNANPTGFYYQGITVTDANSDKVMSFPNVQNVNLASVDYVNLENEIFCFDDFTFNISNNTERVYGLCTAHSEYPNLGAIGTTSGQRNVTGNASLILGNNVTLYEMMMKGTPISYGFTASDGANGYKFTFPKTKFAEGSMNPSGNNEALKVPFTWQALLNSNDGTEIIIEKVTV